MEEAANFRCAREEKMAAEKAMNGRMNTAQRRYYFCLIIFRPGTTKIEITRKRIWMLPKS